MRDFELQTALIKLKNAPKVVITDFLWEASKTDEIYAGVTLTQTLFLSFCWPTDLLARLLSCLIH
jgi:hypothetical protein